MNVYAIRGKPVGRIQCTDQYTRGMRSGEVEHGSRTRTPADIGKAAAFLCSDDADYITGSALTVDGGYLLGMRLA